MSNFLADDGTFKSVTGSGGGALATANNLSELTASASTARSNISAAKSGANSDITSATALSYVDEISGEIRYPEDKTYVVILDSKTSKTLNEVTVKTRVGSTVVTPKIGSTTLGGGASAASTSKASVTHTTSNAMSATDTLNFVLSSTSTDCEDMSFTVKYTRTVS